MSGREPGLAVVTVVAGRHDRLRRQRDFLSAGDVVPGLHVVVAMGDPEVATVVGEHPDAVVIDIAVGADRRLPLAAARNLGARTAAERGMRELVFLDVDVLPAAGLIGAYCNGLAARPGAVLSGAVAYLPEGVVDAAEFGAYPPHPARPAPEPGEIEPMADVDLFWSLSFGTGVQTWTRVGGFDEGYTGYGGEDTDFAQRCVAAGVPLAWLGGAVGHHLHHPVSSPPVEHLDDILRNGRRFAARWGRWPMAGWLAEFERLGLVEQVDGDWRRV